MDEKLDFSLPVSKQSGSAGSKITIVLLVILIVIGVVNLVMLATAPVNRQDLRPGRFSPEQVKQLASKLAARDLYDSAVRVWQDYLDITSVSDDERARILFQIGTLLEKADKNAEAIEYYYRSEMAAKVDELTPQINVRVKDCFEKVGLFSALRYEIMERTSMEGNLPAGGDVVAQIGVRKITLAQLDSLFEKQIDRQLSQYAAFMSAEQLAQQKKTMLEQVQNPQTKLNYLQNWVAEEILYREALEKGLAEEAGFADTLHDLRRSVLSQKFMARQLATKINLTEVDFRTYYQTRKENYVEPAKARIRHILVETESEAEDLIAKIKAGEDFADLAGRFSKDEATSESGGLIDTEITKGSYIPGFGQLDELSGKIFSAKADDVLDEPIKTDTGWEIVKVDSLVPQRQKGFEEVAEQVISELTGQKQKEVSQQLINELMNKHDVVIHSSVLTGVE